MASLIYSGSTHYLSPGLADIGVSYVPLLDTGCSRMLGTHHALLRQAAGLSCPCVSRALRTTSVLAT